MTCKRVYFDNAASTFPKPASVLFAVGHQLRQNTANPGRSGHFLSREAAQTLYRCRAEIGAFFGAEPEHVIWTQNASQALNTLLFGLLKKGDLVLVSDREHNAVLRPLKALEERGVTFRVVRTGNDPVGAFEKALSSAVKMVVCTHASNVTGRVFDVEKIGAAAHRHGALMAVDASQSAGFLPLRLDGGNVDFICAPGHKGLYGIPGSGLLLLAHDTALVPLVYGGNGLRSLEDGMGDELPERLEAGTVSLPAAVSVAAGIRYLCHGGKDGKNRETDVFLRCRDALGADPRVTLYEPDGDHVPVLAFNLDGRHSEDVTAALDARGFCVRGGYHCAKLTHESLGTTEQGAVRLSFSVFNTQKEALRFKKVLSEL